MIRVVTRSYAIETPVSHTLHKANPQVPTHRLLA